MQYKILFSKDDSLSKYKVNFSGLQQSERTQTYINDVVRSLTPRVPAKSCFILNISEIDNQVTGHFKSLSASSKFESVQKSESAEDVMDLISDDINKQIDGWLEQKVV